jgi:hypothetical protein
MIHFILTAAQAESIKDHRDVVSSDLRKGRSDIEPIELADGTFCIPDPVERDAAFVKLKERLDDRGIDIRTIPKREVDPIEVKNKF